MIERHLRKVELPLRVVRIDLVGVLLAERGAAEVEHVQGVG